MSKKEQQRGENRLEVVRHSAAHIMAQAVQSILPDVKLGIGPAIKNGFYYDFGLSRPLTADDLSVISPDKLCHLGLGSFHSFPRSISPIVKAGQITKSLP